MLLIGQVASTLILAVAVIIVAGILGPERYADYTITMVPIGIATLLMDPGITAALTKHIALYQHQGKDEERRAAQLTGTTINIAIASALTIIVFAAASPITAFYKRPELTPLLQTASLAILGQALLNLSQAIFIGYNRMSLQSLTTVLYAMLKGVAMPGLVYIGLSSSGAVVGNMVALLAAGIIGMLLTLAFIKGGDVKITADAAQTMLRYGAPIYLSAIISGALAQIQSNLTIVYLTNTEIGNWGAAQNFAILVTFLTTPIATTLFPLFSKLERGTANLSHAYRNAVKYSSLIALPGASALIALSYPMMIIVYGAKYPLAPEYFRLFLLTYAPIGLGSVCLYALLNGQGETRMTFRLNLANLLIGAPLSLILIPRLGVTGLILTLIVTPLPSILYSIHWIRKTLKLEPDWGGSAKIYASSLAALLTTTAATTLTPDNTWLQLILGGLTYLTTYLATLKLTHALNGEDYRMFRTIIGDTGPLATPLNRLLDTFEKL